MLAIAATLVSCFFIYGIALFFKLSNDLSAILILLMLTFSLWITLPLAANWTELIAPKESTFKNAIKIIADSYTTGGIVVCVIFLEALNYLFFALVISPVIYLFARFGYGGLQWLKEGVWYEYTPCITFEIYCEAHTKWVGLNKVLLWLGESDLIYPVLAISMVSLFLFIQTDNFKKH
jgi:hypothetical protein